MFFKYQSRVWLEVYAGRDIEQSAMDQLQHMFYRDVNNLALDLILSIIFSISSGSGRDFNNCPAIANASTLCVTFMKHLLIAALILFVQELKGQSNDSLLVSNGEIKLFLKETRHLISKTAKFRLANQPTLFPSRKLLGKLLSSETLVSNADIDYIIDQANRSVNYIWDSTLVDSTVFLNSTMVDSIFLNVGVDSGWNVFSKIHHGSDFYRMSIPCFSQDRQTCLIYIGHYCGGLCGGGGFRIFIRRDEGWVNYKTIGHWAN